MRRREAVEREVVDEEAVVKVIINVVVFLIIIVVKVLEEVRKEDGEEDVVLREQVNSLKLQVDLESNQLVHFVKCFFRSVISRPR